MSYAPMPVNLERIHDKVATLAANAPTLRDQFAMAALPAVIAAVCDGHISPRPNVAPTEIIAEEAYKVADAMLAARGGL